MIHIGDTLLGERVEIPIFHTGLFGQSGTGKTKTQKYMISQVIEQGFTVIIFDSKVTGPEFEGIGEPLPFYLEESADPDVFRSLLEGMRTRGKGNMERFRGGFIEVCDRSEDFQDIGEKLRAKLADTKTIKGYTRAMYSEINYDYQRLMRLLGDERFVSQDEITLKVLKAKGKIFTMPTWKLPNLALQGLVVRSVVELLLRVGEHIIFLVDEAPNFVNQKKYNPAKDALQTLDAQGRKDSIFGWYSGQTLTGFDKANMKNLWYWVIGREMEVNEAKDAHATQTTKILTVDQIRKLKVREFLVITPEDTRFATVPHVDEKALFKIVGHTPVTHSEAHKEVIPKLENQEDWSDIAQGVSELEAKLA